MRYLLCYFQTRVVDGVTVFVYSTKKSYRGQVNVGSTSKTFSVTYWDGKPKDTSPSSGSLTLWLNGVGVDEIELYKDVYGVECYLQVDENDTITLITKDDYQSLETSQQNLVQPTVFAS